MKIEILFPEVCNLYGELMNAEYLARCCGGEIIKTALKETPAFVNENIDLVYMGTTTERGQSLVRDALMPYKNEIRNRTAEGKVTLVTGNAMEVFGRYIEDEDGSRESMLGLYDIYSGRQMKNRYNSLYLGKFEKMDIVGFKSQFGHSYGNNGEGIFETVRGAGLNPDTKAEGIRERNFMATYVIGPLVILNPPFARYLLQLMGDEAAGLEFEEAVWDAYHTRVKEFSDPQRGFIYR